jgi:hypothetical protein
MHFTSVLVPIAAAVVGRAGNKSIIHRAWAVVLDVEFSGQTPPAAKRAKLAASVTAVVDINVRATFREWAESPPITADAQLAGIQALLARLAEAADPLLQVWEPGVRWSWALTEMQAAAALEGLDGYDRPTAVPHLYDTLSIAAYAAPAASIAWAGTNPDAPSIDAVGIAPHPAWANGARLRVERGALMREAGRSAPVAGGDAALQAVLRYLRVKPPIAALANGRLLGTGLLAAGLATPTVQALALANGLVQPLSSGVAGLFDLPRLALDDGSGLGELLDRAADTLYLEGVVPNKPYALQILPVAHEFVELVHKEAAGLCFTKAMRPLDRLEPPAILLTLDKVLARYGDELTHLGETRFSNVPAVVNAAEAVRKSSETAGMLVDIATKYDGDKKKLGQTLALLLWLKSDKPAADAFKPLLEPKRAIWISRMDQLTNPGHGEDVFGNFDATNLSAVVATKGLDVVVLSEDELKDGLIKVDLLERDLNKTLDAGLLEKKLDTTALLAESNLKLNQGMK